MHVDRCMLLKCRNFPTIMTMYIYKVVNFMNSFLLNCMQYLLHCLLALSRWVEPEAWSRSHVPALSLSLLQDTFHTPLPLSLPPHTLATAALYLAVFCCRLPVPG